MIAATIMTVLAFLALILKLSPTTRKRLMGYDLIVDIAVTCLFAWLLGASGTISGMMVAIAAGLLFSITLLFAKNIGSYQVLKRTGFCKWTWEEFEGPWRVKARDFYYHVTMDKTFSGNIYDPQPSA